MRPRVTVISHFYNEALLLPYWIRHHAGVFDHGVLIDYHSTDGSAALARALAPAAWEVITSANYEFAAAAVDEEVMLIERRMDGWKIALNTTEFLLATDLHARIASLEAVTGVSAGPDDPAVAFHSWVLVDPPDRPRPPLDPGQDLVLQCRYGYNGWSPVRDRPPRFLHRRPDGQYAIGRHSVPHPHVEWTDVPLAWAAFAPWPEARARKLQIQTRIPESDRAREYGWQHLVDEARLEEFHRGHHARSFDLDVDPTYGPALQAWRAWRCGGNDP